VGQGSSLRRSEHPPASKRDGGALRFELQNAVGVGQKTAEPQRIGRREIAPLEHRGIPGVLLMVAAFTFYKLDERTSFLIKHAGQSRIELEKNVPGEAGVFTSEANKTKHSAKLWTYGKCFRLTFGLFGLSGISGAIYCGVMIATSPG
jgi:hypothetical protein